MDLLRRVMKAIRNNIDRAADIADSFSDNQFKSKDKIIELLNDNDLIGSNTKVVIMGCWYGSILVDYLAPKVNHITAIDIDDTALRIGKNILFSQYDNIDWIHVDLFNDKNRRKYREATLFINPSCEHMQDMKNWPYFPKDSFFVFTSNDMFDIKDHTNCVNTLEEFKTQLPKYIPIEETEVEDSRGKRFIVIGQIC